MKRLLVTISGFVLLTAFLAIPIGSLAAPGNSISAPAHKGPITPDDWGPAPRSGRLIVAVDGPVTPDRLEALGEYGAVHGWIDRYNMVAITPSGPRDKAAIDRLTFVAATEEDLPRYLNAIATWDRDILDVADVEESGLGSGFMGAPDAREVEETGDGVHVAVIDTGLIKEWRTFLDEEWVATDLAKAFMGGGAVAEDFVPWDAFHASNPENLWERDTNSHGIAVASHIVGFKIGNDRGDGTAPDATIIPLKVFPNGAAFTWGSRIIASIAYVTNLKEEGRVDSVVINMSLGGGAPGVLEERAIDDAIDAGVIVVASAGNAGEAGMGWPGAYPQVISAGATGWTEQFRPGTLDSPNFAFWWDQDVGNDPDGTGVSEEFQSFVTTFSSRARPDVGEAFGTTQELDVLAPGQWTVAPCIIQGVGRPTFCFWAGTSFSSPLVAGVAALLLEKNPGLVQADVEDALKSTALGMDGDDFRPDVLSPFIAGAVTDISWDTDCDGATCDPVGSGLVQADAALGSV